MAKPVLVPVGPDFSLSAASVDLNLKAHRVQLEENVPPSATVTDEAAYFAGGTAVTTDFTYTGIWFGSDFSDRMMGDDFGNLFSVASATISCTAGPGMTPSAAVSATTPLTAVTATTLSEAVTVMTS